MTLIFYYTSFAKLGIAPLRCRETTAAELARVMTLETTILILACGLGLIHIILASHSASLQKGYRWSASARDAEATPLTGMAGRFSRALTNFTETFPYFATASLMASQFGVHDWRTALGSELYLGARALYLPLYAMGVPVLRSLVWNVAIAGIACVFWAVATH